MQKLITARTVAVQVSGLTVERRSSALTRLNYCEFSLTFALLGVSIFRSEKQTVGFQIISMVHLVGFVNNLSFFS